VDFIDLSAERALYHYVVATELRRSRGAGGLVWPQREPVENLIETATFSVNFLRQYSRVFLVAFLARAVLWFAYFSPHFLLSLVLILFWTLSISYLCTTDRLCCGAGV